MNYLDTRRSVLKLFSILLLASLLLTSMGTGPGGPSTARAQAAATETPPADPTGIPTEAPATSVSTEPPATVAPTETAVVTEPPAAPAAATETATPEPPSLMLVGPLTGAGTSRHYAKPNALSTNDCSSWNAACDLQTALTWPGTYSGSKEIWVAAGVYTPSSGNRSASFEISASNMNNGVALYGGFVGNEQHLSDRDPRLHSTTLSGDIDLDGNVDADNSYHVVKVDYNMSATFDGFTIFGGYANRGNNYGNDENQGGGVYNAGTLTLRNITFDSNWARYGGGLENAFPFTATLTNVTFVGNHGDNDGGGMHNCAGSTPVVTNATFYDNDAAGRGGAIANGSQVTCGSTGNHQGNGAGGIGNGSTFRNVTVSGNSAGNGAGISNTQSAPAIYDSIFYGDTSEFYRVGSAPLIVDSIVYNGCPTGAICTNVINSDPLLDTAGLADNGGYTYTIAIPFTSPAKDAGGVNSACPPPSTDQRGVTRPQGAACDIGAYEIKQHSISGNTVLPGVLLGWDDGGAKTTTSDGSGNYSFFVSDGWTGTVTPTLAGYTFVPPNRSYTNVTTDFTAQNYQPYVAISGSILGGLTSPLCTGVTLSWTDGVAKTAHPTYSAGNCTYSIAVSYNSTETVTPSLTGYTFAPPSRTYTSILAAATGQDYTATLITFTITGSITGGLSSSDCTSVTLSWTDAVAKTTHPSYSAPNCTYSITVPYNWSGTVTPTLTAYTFSPPSRTYTNVLANQTLQDYAALPAVTISGTITGGLSSSLCTTVTLSWNDGGAKTTHPIFSSPNCIYSISVPNGWTGTVTPSLSGYTFSPSSRPYLVGVTTDQPGQDFTAITITISGSITGGVSSSVCTSIVLAWNDNGAQTANPSYSNPNCTYSIRVPSGWTGTVTPSRSGYSFIPDHITYTAITTNQTLQDYAAHTPVTISGHVGGPGLGWLVTCGGVSLSYFDVTAKTANPALVNCNYSFTVTYNWTGTVTPSLSGYAFSPLNIPYTNLTANATNQNYTATATLTPTDFDGDGKSDPAKFVPAAGAVWDLQSSTATWAGKYIGADGSYVWNSNFDGDKMTDPAKYVASAGAVWYLGSSDAAWHGIYIGNDGTYISGSDFDGDGKTDPAKFVASSGSLWYLQSSDNTLHGVYIGNDGAYVPGSDFDGDGKTDPAKYVAGAVYYLQSSTGTWASKYIGSDGAYIPRSDFDGDGKTDPAKFVNGTLWYLASSTNTLVGKALGSDGTVVPGADFDGDGKTDPAKFVPSTGSIWYMQSSASDAWAGVYMGSEAYQVVN